LRYQLRVSSGVGILLLSLSAICGDSPNFHDQYFVS